MNIQAIFSDNLRKYRKKAKFTQEKLAEMCDTNHRYIGQIENGTRCPSLDFVEKIAAALNVSPSLLFYDQNDTQCNSAPNITSEQRQKIKAMLFENFTKICSIIDEKN